MTSPWLIAIDMDGTLLRKDHSIGAATNAAIQNAISQGHIVAIATGRPPRAALKAYRELRLTTPLIALNGAFIRFSEQPGDILKYTISLDIIEAIGAKAITLGSRGMLAEFGTHCVIRQDNRAFFNNADQESFFYQAVVAETPNQPPIIQALGDSWSSDAFSLLLQLSNHGRKIITEWIEVRWPQQISCRSWRQPFDVLEVMAKGVNKATGLQKIQAHYNIPNDRILAFGDEMNDVEMFKYATVSVAMGNANPELLPYANAVTKNCEEDGIAEYLNSHFSPSSILS